MTTGNGAFVWHELVTADPEAAEDFYTRLIGWTTADSGMTEMRYTLAKIGEQPVAGIMGYPPGVPDPHPAWLGYIHVDDVDAKAQHVKELGGAIHREPSDIPNVGRFAVAADRQGAVFMLFRGDGTPPPKIAPGTPGRPAWGELHSTDWESGFDFYSQLFGWEKAESFEGGPEGLYQVFSLGGLSIGGMMNNSHAPRPFWLYYFVVDDIDAAAKRLVDGGGKVLNGPMPVPGDMWVIQAFDAQGAVFGMIGPRTGG
jgi:predicted enzyme related to lactoylglutathione lyase